MKAYEMVMGSLIVLVQALLPDEMRQYMAERPHFLLEMALLALAGWAFMVLVSGLCLMLE